MSSCRLLLPESAAVSLPGTEIESGLPSLPVLRPKLRSGDDRIGNQRRFCNIVGGVISPLLSNIYMRRFVKGWKTGGHEKRLKARIVNYADDFVICCRGTADEAMAVMQGMMSKLKLTVNETKTRLCRLPEESFDFLGYTIGRCYSPRTGEAYIGPRPSRKSIQRFCREVSEMTEWRWASRQVDHQVAEINRKLKGWANYFRLGTVQQAYRLVDNHVRYRLRRWLKAKYKVRGPGKTRFGSRSRGAIAGIRRP
jgi:RNA-directed DNA polymerase